MRRTAIVLLLLTPLATAQVLLSPAELARVRPIFETNRGEPALHCSVTPLAPEINFAFRFHAGYTFQVPQSQYSGPSGTWSVLTAITPDDGDATYLLARSELSEVSRAGGNFEIHGAYFLGVGHYSVESTVRDDRNRVCRKQWQVVVGPSRGNRDVPLALLPNSVRPFSPVIPPGALHQDPAPPLRVSVLLNAAAFSTYRTTLRPYDREVLIGALTSLTEHLPSASVRLVVFSLEQQREIFRAENFSPPDLARAARAIRSMQQATVDVRLLQKPLGHVDFLLGLIGRERDAPNPSDTIVFLGPISRYGNRIPKSVLPAPAEDSPRFFYLRYETPRHVSAPAEIPGVMMPDSTMPGLKAPPAINAPPSTGGPVNTGGPMNTAGPYPSGVPMGSAEQDASSGGGRGGGARGRGGRVSDLSAGVQASDGQTDVIVSAMHRLKGKILTIHTPADLAKAIRKIEGER